MNHEELIEAWKYEEQQLFTGWDFSYLNNRMVVELPPWSYLAQAAELMRQSSAVLDMGTGGGERLLELRKDWPEKVVVTEDYPPNVKLAKKRLSQLGVKVVNVSLGQEDLLPFEDGEFDLVLNRHSGLNCAEIAHILSPGGIFLTQQIHSLWAQDLLAEFGATPQWPDATPKYYASKLKMAGLDIEQVEDWHGRLVFQDVGAIVYYLKAVPWLVPNFSVASHTVNLLRLQDKLQHEGQLTFEARQYLIKACKAN